MPKVNFLPDNVDVDVADGENLLRAAMQAEVHLSATCGGAATCGKCRVILEKGKLESCEETELLSAEEKQKGYHLACLCKVKEDIQIRIPVEARRGERAVLDRLREAAAFGVMLTAEDIHALADFKVNPLIKKVYVEVEEPSLSNNADDLSRLLLALKKAEGWPSTPRQVDYDVLVDLADKLREQDFKVTVSILALGDNQTITKVEPGDTTKNNLALAYDVGTTTLYAEVIDLNSGEILGKASDYNPQISFGEDVIARIVYSTKEDGLQKLQKAAIEDFNKLSGEALKKSSRSIEEVSIVTAAGNTTMAHLFLGISPKNIRKEPYIPTVTHWPPVKSSKIGLNAPEGSRTFVLPGRASYVGGDITAGVLASGMYTTEKLTLYIDVGTNGEIVLGNKDWLMACSCSAGPAFEGGTIRHGCRATVGAIEQVRLNWEDYEPMILTIRQAKPIGLCGSGLITALAELFLAKVINSRGKINLDLPTGRTREGEFGPEYVLVYKKDAKIDRDIVLTEVDIDNLIRAKAAVYAGITTLLDNAGVTIDEVEQVFIAGGFGNYLELDKAMLIGLFPETDGSKVKFLGNGSLLGARLAAISAEAYKELDNIAKRMTYIELSVDPTFMDRYMAALFLPHTDINLFPTVKKLVEGNG